MHVNNRSVTSNTGTSDCENKSYLVLRSTSIKYQDMHLARRYFAAHEQISLLFSLIISFNCYMATRLYVRRVVLAFTIGIYHDCDTEQRASRLSGQFWAEAIRVDHGKSFWDIRHDLPLVFSCQIDIFNQSTAIPWTEHL